MAEGLSSIRNIGIIAHIDAGKTTLTERMLFLAGEVRLPGEVDNGTTMTDFDPEEQERGITIASAAVTCRWQKHSINIIDTPGHVDFTAEVERCLRVLDGAVGVFDGVAGVEAQSETVWRQADRYGVPRIAFINKLDRVGSNFKRAMGSLQNRLGANPLPLQIPIGSEGGFRGVIDLLTLESLTFEADDFGADAHRQPLPDEYAEEAAEAREALVETLLDAAPEKLTETVFQKWDKGEDIGAEDLKPLIRASCLSGELTPVLCGSALKYKGVQPVLDAVCDFLPSPSDRPPARAHTVKTGKETRVEADPKGPLTALAFKTVWEKWGELCYVRVYSGVLKSGKSVYNPGKEKAERIQRIWTVMANRRTQVDALETGGIGAVAGLRFTDTGDTLCERKKAILFESMVFPAPVISMAVEPKTTAEKDKLAQVLERLAREDPTFTWRLDEETGQTLVSGMGELHLEVLKNRMLRDHKVNAIVGKPRVAYREAAGVKSRGLGRFHRSSPSGKTQYAEVVLELEPQDAITVDFESAVTDDVVSPRFLPSVKEGALGASWSGPVMGFPVIRTKVRLVGGTMNESDSTEVAFAAAAREAFENALETSNPQVLEPIMSFEVTVPDTYQGGVISDLNARRAEIHEVEKEGDIAFLRGVVPLAEMFGYTSDLRSLTQGRGACSMEPAAYAPLPENARKKLLG